MNQNQQTVLSDQKEILPLHPSKQKTSMNSEKSELIWVSKKVAQQYAEIENGKAAEDFILKYVANLRKDIEVSTQALDEDIAMLRARGIAYKRAFAAAFEDEQKAIMDLWNESQTRGQEAKKQAEQQTADIRRVTSALAAATTELRDTIDAIQTWKIQEVFETIENLKAALDALTPELKSTLKVILNDENKN